MTWLPLEMEAASRLWDLLPWHTLLLPVTNLSSAKLTAGPPETSPLAAAAASVSQARVHVSLLWCARSWLGVFSLVPRVEGWDSCSKASSGSGMAYVKSRQLLAFFMDGTGAHEDLRCLSIVAMVMQPFNAMRIWFLKWPVPEILRFSEFLPGSGIWVKVVHLSIGCYDKHLLSMSVKKGAHKHVNLIVWKSCELLCVCYLDLEHVSTWEIPCTFEGKGPHYL